MKRILAIDYGTKSTGLAVTDVLQMIANPLRTVHTKDLLPFLKDYVLKEPVETIVIGDPRNMDGTPSGPIEALANFVKAVENSFRTLKIERMDERFTSRMAYQTLKDAGASKKQRASRENVDTISAVIILQSYMEQQKFRKH